MDQEMKRRVLNALERTRAPRTLAKVACQAELAPWHAAVLLDQLEEQHPDWLRSDDAWAGRGQEREWRLTDQGSRAVAALDREAARGRRFTSASRVRRRFGSHSSRAA